MNFTSSQELISYIYALPKRHEKADLSSIKKVLAILGNPQDQVKTIHITGTNGKGSTSYYLNSLLQKAGQKTGLFVSPYVYEFNERIQLNGQNIAEQDLLVAASRVEEALQRIRQKDPLFTLVTFEYEVAMAFVYFAQERCDYAVIEVGIGGEHDKTNVITPEVSVITTVGLDHEEVIGPTIQDIAREKSGVIKKRRPVVLGNVPRAVLPIIRKKAHAEQAPISQLGRDFALAGEHKDTYVDRVRRVPFKAMPDVEKKDAAIAIRAFYLLGLDLEAGQAAAAINETIVPGRYQILKERPLIVLDGAHNVQAVKNLLAFVHQQQEWRGGRVRILIMMMKDKDMAQVFSLFSATDEVALTTIDYPRAAQKGDFPAWVEQKYPFYPQWRAAFKEIYRDSQPNDILLVTGSFYLVGAILQSEAKNVRSRHR